MPVRNPWWTCPHRPQLDPLRERTPYTVVTLQGFATFPGRIIITSNCGNPVVDDVGPGGEFCKDLSIDLERTCTYEVFAQDNDGAISERSASVTVRQDPNSAADPNAVTCASTHPSGPPAMYEDCLSPNDDDEDGLINSQDPDCQGDCADDLWEDVLGNSNSPATAPRVALVPVDGVPSPTAHVSARLDDMRMCNQDCYGVHVRPGQRLQVVIRFASGMNVILFGPDNLGGGLIADQASGSSETVLTATDPGDYAVCVDGPRNGQTYMVQVDLMQQ